MGEPMRRREGGSELPRHEGLEAISAAGLAAGEEAAGEDAPVGEAHGKVAAGEKAFGEVAAGEATAGGAAIASAGWRPSDAEAPLDAPHVPHAPHEDNSFHHHHSHGPQSAHPGHHHLLTVEDLSISFRAYKPDEGFFEASQAETPVIHGLSLSVHEGEILAVVGASGSGKTLLADAILGLFEPNATVHGRIWFDGQPQTAETLAQLRGSRIAFVPQSVESLDPLMRVGAQVEGQARSRAQRQERCERRRQLFARYGLDEGVARLYPHQLSGGMARRILLCCALMARPQLVVADEPTPGLDLPLALKAMEDFRALANQGTGVLLITHDIELALKVADRVAVFKDGTVVEETSVESFANPQLLRHPFTRALWHALPEHDFAAAEGEDHLWR
ncbi:ATP-binding cassette domain-containing protein [Parvibacter caecicola]|uniref:Nickel import system ATP-binding protein NikD n=1 Tax=Parvibacter caecicola TaxID=747645 RepID=A0A7W5GPC9_9ACTN|nr:ABC transporter ATP-binding protein [Parvibacter caecicola]MBB3170296.1 peptide/nickel transport system ATP-binding protein [Parvibacter caecicola]MCR2041738.1 ABC transporter ATP-binding protein [Parvibacter caecicola]